jgi:hypothetical protein
VKAQKVKQVIKVGKISKKDLDKLTRAGYSVQVCFSKQFTKAQNGKLRLLK